ncbi:dTDP-4-dehydrorhamnose 3,5-epimerase family protein [Pseudonocardia parietis]|uniref:dTDP-4-dehydrorhamnose 3,5-epimerase n=1 Tax=Pseudonocardia parietis TaxID=570936 RepID=A0ABS4W6R6_9PSEU|nr:dTDP-4-dehydrorhamnose 3,5-epimerase family protein [Pseudonocardia parietis]MBP2371899.1 dTDP-4-dehydrorhamnose 3,5-epimerase [Pseudonocardia parietis]
MHFRSTSLPGVLLFTPTPHHDERGFFSRTADARTLINAGIDPAGFVQDSQSRSRQGVVRGMHGRTGTGEAKLVRCSHGALFDVVVDARPDSPTFGQRAQFRLDDDHLWSLYLPRGVLHGFQALTETADICYRIDAEHDPRDDVAVRYADPDLAIPWPLPVSLISDRDAAASSWRDAVPHLRRHGSRLTPAP